MIEGCDGCKYWVEIRGLLAAICLNDKSQNRRMYTHYGCEHREEGKPIDSPEVDNEQG